MLAIDQMRNTVGCLAGCTHQRPRRQHGAHAEGAMPSGRCAMVISMPLTKVFSAPRGRLPVVIQVDGAVGHHAPFRKLAIQTLVWRRVRLPARSRRFTRHHVGPERADHGAMASHLVPHMSGIHRPMIHAGRRRRFSHRYHRLFSLHPGRRLGMLGHPACRAMVHMPVVRYCSGGCRGQQDDGETRAAVVALAAQAMRHNILEASPQKRRR